MESKNYFINHPIFLKYKKRFDWKRLRRMPTLKSVHVNERIIEIPFAIQSLASLAPGSRILDLGCTESPLPLQLAALGYTVTGYDFREYPYSHPNLTVVQGDITQLPFRDEHFDAVLAISTIEHVGIGFYQDPRDGRDSDHRAIVEALRVLKKQGLFILTIPYGIACDNDHQRIYDQPRLAKLSSNIKIKQRRYFQTCALPNGLNTWIEVTEEEASGTPSPSRTNAVCLIAGVKDQL